MKARTMSRRNLPQAGAGALAGGAGWLPVVRNGTLLPITAVTVAAETGTGMTKEETIRKYYSGWEKANWGAIDSVLADNFTFTSPNDDDHLDKRAFKTKCWSQTDYIARFELESVIGKGDEAFVRYLCRTKNGKSFRNVEYFRFRGEKVEAIEVYFGGRQNFPSAVSLGQS